jgi:Tol biopolymer transport system component
LAGTVAAVLICVPVGAAASRAGVRGRTGTIAFLRSGSGIFTRSGLFAIQADGSGLRRLTPTGSDVSAYAWSPDGSRIAYLDMQGALRVVRPDGTTRRLLAGSSPSRGHWGLTWSPDGKAIAVVAGPATGPPATSGKGYLDLRIVVIPTDGGEQHRLPTRTAFNAEWSPRGDEIAYLARHGIWIIRGDGRNRHPLHVYLFAPKWSPDGKHLAFAGCRIRHGRCVARYGGIYVSDADGGNLHLVTGHAYNEYGFAWSPDGRSILYGRANRKGIYVIDADGRNNHRLTRDSPRPVEWGALTWAPDGRSIAYATDRTGHGDIYVIDGDGHNKGRLTNSAASDIDPSWSPR